MKYTYLSDKTIPIPSEEDKYVNYAVGEGKVNYFGELEEPTPEFPEIPEKNKPALEDIPEGVSIAVNEGGFIAFKSQEGYTQDSSKPVLGLGIKSGGNAFIIGLPDKPLILKWSEDQEDIKALPNTPLLVDLIIKDFSSKDNTSRMLEAKPTQVPSAAYCRNYTSNGLGKGKWDLPAAGIVQIMIDSKDSIIGALTILGNTVWKNVFTSQSLWSSTEFNNRLAWDYNFNLTSWYNTDKTWRLTVAPTYTLYQEETDLSEMMKPSTEMPEGISILDINGDYILPSRWVTGNPWTGIALNTPEWAGILGVGTNFLKDKLDDLSINSRKDWSNSTYGTDIPDLPNFTSSANAITDFDSKGNTDKIIAAVKSNDYGAAVMARNYSSGVLGKGKWDLPAAGVLNVVLNHLEEFKTVLKVLGTPWEEILDTGWLWSSSEYTQYYAWALDGFSKKINFLNRIYTDYGWVMPVHSLSLPTPPIDPKDIVLPEGVSVVDGAGNVMQASEWTEDKGLTGLGINNGEHSFIMGVADKEVNQRIDDLSINSRKDWSNSTYGTDIPDLPNFTSSANAITDFDSKGNTDKIIAAVKSGRNPLETNNAAIVCREFFAGVGLKGKWDLPAAGILNIVVQYKAEVIEALKAIGKPSGKFISYWVWSSTEYGSNSSWYYSFYNSRWYSSNKYDYYFVVPVLTIS